MGRAGVKHTQLHVTSLCCIRPSLCEQSLQAEMSQKRGNSYPVLTASFSLSSLEGSSQSTPLLCLHVPSAKCCGTPQRVGFAAYSGQFFAASVCSNAPRFPSAPVPPPASALPHDGWRSNVCKEKSGPSGSRGVTYIARNHFTHHFNGNYFWDETSQLFAVCRKIMQQLSEEKRERKQKKSPDCSRSSFNSRCFILLSEFRSPQSCKWAVNE